MLKTLRSFLKWVGVGLCLALLSGCGNSGAKHALVGAWQASDGTVFIFRDDGTFTGRDYVNRRIFGSWVSLDAERIGFQSLMHAGVYLPQYAEVTPQGMRYAYSDGSRFVEAAKIDPAEALDLTLAARLNIKDPR
jgi:hypothetical protein